LNAKAQSENDDRGIVLAVGEDKAGNKPMNIGRAGEAQMNVTCLPAARVFQPALVRSTWSRIRRASSGRSAPFGELHAARLATEERRAHFPLELTDLQAEGRLFDPEPFGCAGEMQLLATATK
jgi:hypothetical protein